jgi:Ca-activated chloride channel homolog
MFNPSVYRNSSTSGAAFMEVVQSRETGADPETPERQPVLMPLKETELTGSVTGPVAQLQIRHVFGHPDEANGPVLEAVYRFPLPGDAAVTGVVITFGETRIRAELGDRRDAEQVYDEARRTGRQAVLLTRESPDVFSLHVSGIEAGQDVEITTDFVQSLKPRRDGFTLRIPLTVTPRFVSPHARGGRHEHGQPLALTHDPGHRLALNLRVPGSGTVTSSTHEIVSSSSSEGSVVTFEAGEVIPDRDLVLQVHPEANETRPALQVFHYPDDEAGHDYILALVQPPKVIGEEDARPREIILLVDRSGSMSGPKWEAADWAVQKFLSGLRPEDHFSLGLFHSTTNWFSRVSVPASSENVEAARDFIDAHNDSGGTRLELALEEAITCGRASGDMARHIVIITDAQVSNARDNLALARAESERSNSRRISMLCIDAAPNSWLVHELTAIGGGQATFLTSDPDEGDITTALDEVMEFWGTPVESGMELTINRSDVWVMGRPVSDAETSNGDVGTIDLGDLPASQPIWVVARAAKSDIPLGLSLGSHNGQILNEFSEVTEVDDAIKKLFGARRMASLEFQLEPASSAWRKRHQNKHAINEMRRQLVNESLHYGLVSSETSFFAVREEGGKLVQRGAVVPNALAAGWSESFAVYNRMADSALPATEMLESYRAAPVFNEPEARDSGLEFLESYLESPASRAFDRGGTLELFAGRPDLSSPEITLATLDRFGKRGRLTALQLTVSDDDQTFDGELLLFIGRDPDPRVRVRVRDILRQGGYRPLNLRIRRHEQLRLVLREVTAGDQIPEIEIKLDWDAV